MAICRMSPAVCDLGSVEEEDEEEALVDESKICSADPEAKASRCAEATHAAGAYSNLVILMAYIVRDDRIHVHTHAFSTNV